MHFKSKQQEMNLKKSELCTTEKGKEGNKVPHLPIKRVQAKPIKEHVNTTSL